MVVVASKVLGGEEAHLLALSPVVLPSRLTIPMLGCHPALQAIVQQMGGELERFQRERAQEMGYVLRDFALAQARVSGDTARLWASLVPGLAAAAGGDGGSGS